MLILKHGTRAARRSSATFAALIIVAACDAAAPTESIAPLGLTRANAVQSSSAAAGAERVVYEALHDQQGSEVFVECADGSVSESVALTGKIFERFGHYTINANGEVTVSRERLVAECEG